MIRDNDADNSLKVGEDFVIILFESYSYCSYYFWVNLSTKALSEIPSLQSEDLFIDRISSWLASLHVENSGTAIPEEIKRWANGEELVCNV